MCSKFTIYGERCSGTNFLEEIMLANFDIVVTWDYGWKQISLPPYMVTHIINSVNRIQENKMGYLL